MKQRIFTWPSDAAPTSGVDGIEIVDVTAANAHRVEDFRENLPDGLFQRFVSEGREGVFAVQGEKVVGHAWLSAPVTRKTTVNGYFRVVPGQRLIHFCHVDRRARGKGIYGAMLHALVNQSIQEGGDRVFVDTEAGNVPSIRGIERAGFESLGLSYYLLLGPLLVFRHQRSTHK